MSTQPASRSTRPPLTPELWQRVKQVAGDALEQPDALRPAFVASACAGDTVLQQEVESLLRSTARAGDRLEALPAAITPLAPGTLVGPYRLVRELGTGGMGAVYLAERADDEFEQRVAIKVVRGGFASPFLLERVREERRILASLEHSNIARLLDGGATDTGLPYVVMEYVEGEPIDRFCDTRRLTLQQRLEIFCEACAAVHYAHQRLVIHRDIKAGNILVTAERIPKLLDFGIAKLLDPSLRPGEQKATLYRVMTPESASPEQLRGEPLTVAVDVYALGVLLFRLLTGRSPYGDLRSEAELIAAVCDRPAPAASVVARQHPASGPGEAIPTDLDVIVAKALRKEPDRRYGSVEDLAGDVRRYLDGRPVLAAPDSLSYRARKFARRHRIAVAASIALVLTLAGGVAATLWQARIAERERARAETLRARAEREFNAVRGLANSVLGELHDAVTNLPGSTAAREILLRRATEYLDALAVEAGHDSELRRELAAGYRRLAEVQGAAGLQNLGDQTTARGNYLKAAGMLEALRAQSPGDLRDRLALAETYTRLAAFENERAARRALYAQARVLVDGMERLEPPNGLAFSIAAAVWNGLGDEQIVDGQHQEARAARETAVRLGERALAMDARNLSWSRNVSLYYKKLGALLEFFDKVDEAIPYYRRAMALDRERIAQEPGRLLSRLDLSFAFGSMGSALRRKGDFRGAIEHYEQAIALRQEVAARDPRDDFAQTSVAYGFERIAGIRLQAGDVAGAIDAMVRRVGVYRRRLDSHRDRANVWQEYASTATSAVAFGLEALAADAATPPVRRAGVIRIRTLLQQLQATRAEWARAGRPGSLPPSDDELRRLEARLRALGGV
jgi:non-specific serine/threonine protein kinase/serine/threonine-protein kinase